MRFSNWSLLLILPLVGVASFAGSKDESPAGKTAMTGFASVYQTLADSILANKAGEHAVVTAILRVERDLAVEALDRAAAAPDAAKMDLQAAATRMGEFATEGGAVIEPIRNRLLQGGHHHHAQDSGPEAVYDQGYVVLNKVSKVKALEIARRCARLAADGGASAEAIAEIRKEFLDMAAKCLETR